jgi:hypothetical protein
MNTAPTFRVGDRVTYRDEYDRREHVGTLIASPGAVFNGWLVKLDNGSWRGAYDNRLRHAREDT